MQAFTIGRNEDNTFTITNNSVSGNHAKIEISEDFKTFILHDINSTNGTKVNGQAILTKKITRNSQLQFGTYVADSKVIFKELQAYILKNRTHFIKEFNELHEIETNYQKRRYNVNKYFKLKSGLVRGGITIGLMTALFMLPEETISNSLKTPLVIAVGAIGGIISTASVSEKNVKHKLDDLYIEFSEKFHCPKCKWDMTSKSWKFWKSKKQCPKCKCHWVNQTA